jgi:hypothetical protein
MCYFGGHIAMVRLEVIRDAQEEVYLLVLGRQSTLVGFLAIGWKPAMKISGVNFPSEIGQEADRYKQSREE